MFGDNCFEFGIYFFLDVHDLYDNFNDDVCPGSRFFQIQRWLNTCQNRVHLILRHLSFFNIAAKIFFNRIHSTINKFLFDITQGNLITRLSTNLRNTVTH